jgi:Flp pilus assembly pilin Flp
VTDGINRIAAGLLTVIIALFVIIVIAQLVHSVKLG